MEVLEGVRLMVIGMTTVIGFLITLVLCMQVSALFFRWWSPPSDTPQSARATSQSNPNAMNAHLAAAIVIAQHQKTSSEELRFCLNDVSMS